MNKVLFYKKFRSWNIKTMFCLSEARSRFGFKISNSSFSPNLPKNNILSTACSIIISDPEIGPAAESYVIPVDPQILEKHFTAHSAGGHHQHRVGIIGWLCGGEGKTLVCEQENEISPLLLKKTRQKSGRPAVTEVLSSGKSVADWVDVCLWVVI